MSISSLLKVAVVISFTLTSCNRDPKQVYSIPHSYSHDWLISVYDCHNGRDVPKVDGKYTIEVPPSGQVLRTTAYLPTRDSLTRMSIDGTVEKISSSDVEFGNGVEMMQKGMVPIMCSYSYFLLNPAVDNASLVAGIGEACNACTSSVELSLQ